MIVRIRLFELYLCKYHAKHLILTILCGRRIPLPGLSINTSLVFACNSQGVSNRLLLVPIVGGACFLRHQLAGVINASLSFF